MDFFKPRKEIAPTPEPTLQQARIDRRRELSAHLSCLNAQMEDLNERAAKFKAANMRILGGQVVFVSSDFTARLPLEQQWFLLRKRAGEIAVERNAALSELAALARNGSETVHVAGELVTHGA